MKRWTKYRRNKEGEKMTREEIRDFYEKQVAFYKAQIEWSSDQIKWANDELKESRERDRRIVESVWGKGVVTEEEMKLFTKDFQGRDTKYFIKDRAWSYRKRAKDRRRLKEYEKRLQEYS